MLDGSYFAQNSVIGGFHGQVALLPLSLFPMPNSFLRFLGTTMLPQHWAAHLFNNSTSSCRILNCLFAMEPFFSLTPPTSSFPSKIVLMPSVFDLWKNRAWGWEVEVDLIWGEGDGDRARSSRAAHSEIRACRPAERMLARLRRCGK